MNILPGPFPLDGTAPSSGTANFGKHHAYALSVVERLQQAGVRVEADLRNEKVGYKIREALLQKVPYMLVVGDKEMAERQVSVRARSRRSRFTEPGGFCGESTGGNRCESALTLS